MKVFISWSGDESKAIAQILREELPIVINAIEPFVSSEDIEKGVPWFQNISKKLEESSFGIVCLSSANLQSKWLYFEAGALAAKVSQAHVAPLLIDVTDAEVKAPFSQFQLTKLEQGDFFKLLLTINRALKESQLAEEMLKRSFAMWWPPFEKRAKEAIAAIPKKTAPVILRTDREILEEILSTVRFISSKQTSDASSDLSTLLASLTGSTPQSGVFTPGISSPGVFRESFAEQMKKAGVKGVVSGVI